MYVENGITQNVSQKTLHTVLYAAIQLFTYVLFIPLSERNLLVSPIGKFYKT